MILLENVCPLEYSESRILRARSARCSKHYMSLLVCCSIFLYVWSKNINESSHELGTLVDLTNILTINGDVLLFAVACMLVIWIIRLNWISQMFKTQSITVENNFIVPLFIFVTKAIKHPILTKLNTILFEK